MKERIQSLRNQTENLKLRKKRTLVNAAIAGALVFGAHGCGEQEQYDPTPDIFPTHQEHILFDKGIDGQSEVEQQEQKLFHNGKIGIEMSEFLPGIIDLKYYNEDTGEWDLYNNIVPEVIANGRMNNAEMFSLPSALHHTSHEDGTQEIEIRYDKFEGIMQVGDYQFEGNGASFSVVATLMPDTTEATFRVEQHEESASIQSIALGNFFGAKESIRFLEIDGEITDVLSDEDAPDDGNFMIGKFEYLQVPEDRKVRFWSEKSRIVQSQTITTSNDYVDDMRMRTEIRSTPWRPEHSTPGHPFNPERPWLELVEIFQPYSPDATWTFGYEMKDQ